MRLWDLRNAKNPVAAMTGFNGRGKASLALPWFYGDHIVTVGVGSPNVFLYNVADGALDRTVCFYSRSQLTFIIAGVYGIFTRLLIRSLKRKASDCCPDCTELVELCEWHLALDFIVDLVTYHYISSFMIMALLKISHTQSPVLNRTLRSVVV